MKKLCTVLAALFVLAASGCAPQVDTMADQAALGNVAEQYSAACGAGDAAALTALFTDDAVWMPPNQPAKVGKEVIEDQYRALFDQLTCELELNQEEIAVAGDWAFDRTSYTVTLSPKTEGEPVKDRGKYINIYRRQPDGTWKIAAHIWNSDLPAAATTD